MIEMSNDKVECRVERRVECVLNVVLNVVRTSQWSRNMEYMIH